MAICFSSLVDVTADYSSHVRGTQVHRHCRVPEVPVHAWAKRKRPNKLQRSRDYESDIPVQRKCKSVQLGTMSSTNLNRQYES